MDPVRRYSRVRRVLKLRRAMREAEQAYANNPKVPPQKRSVTLQKLRYAPFNVHHQSPLRQVVNTSELADYWVPPPQQCQVDAFMREYMGEPDDDYLESLWGSDIADAGSTTAPGDSDEEPEFKNLLTRIDPILLLYQKEMMEATITVYDNPSIFPTFTTPVNDEPSREHNARSVPAIDPISTMKNSLPPLHCDLGRAAEPAEFDRRSEEEQTQARKRVKYKMAADGSVNEESSEFDTYMP